MKEEFKKKILTGYEIERSGDLVTHSFYYKLVEYLLNTLEYEDLISITWNLEQKNKHLSSTGRPILTKSDSN